MNSASPLDTAAGPARILVVEDESIVAVDLAARLQRLGHQVVGTARSADEAYRIAAAHKPDLVLMDIRLEGEEDGVSVGTRIRHDLDVAVVFLTAYADSRTLERARQAAPLGYIIKPFDQRDLEVTVSVALHRSQLDRRLRRAHDDLRAVLDVQRHGTVVVDSQGCVTLVSRAAERLLGFGAGQALGRPWQTVFPVPAGEVEQLARTLREAPQQRENVLLHSQTAAGEAYLIEVEVTNDARDDSGRMLFLYDVSRVASLERLLDERARFGDIIGHSDPMLKVFALVRDFASIEAPVLVDGETGVGKELVARAMHARSKRAERPFVAVNCAGLNEELASSQLFGHARGAFTSAVSEHEGLFKAADSGTLFLDEIGELPPRVQANLLRVLEEGIVHAVGKTRGEPVDVRIIAATNRDLAREVDAGRFRADLFYRVRAARITVPPLREHKEDIALLVRSFLDEQSALLGKPLRGFCNEALRLLHLYGWPGNVRELRNAVAVAAARARASLIQPEDLPPEILEKATTDASLPRGPLETRLEVLEALGRAGGNRSEAARLLGISRATFYRRLTALGFPAQSE
ncbi:MAG: sigma 54-interacting transcriptional regulator [Deltaproteobacteria bacterium]|nr:sigma 54-interacting transcriptional regulator [Deltaproteobacteria bacterium]